MENRDEKMERDEEGMRNMEMSGRREDLFIFNAPLFIFVSLCITSSFAVWGRYDLLVLPPSFPYGGMENPMLTFVTPTLLAGDR